MTDVERRAAPDTAQAPKPGMPRLNTRKKQVAHLVALALLLPLKFLHILLKTFFSVLKSIA